MTYKESIKAIGQLGLAYSKIIFANAHCRYRA